jgi:hypothetical protein
LTGQAFASRLVPMIEESQTLRRPNTPIKVFRMMLIGCPVPWLVFSHIE